MEEKRVWTEGFVNQKYYPEFGYSSPIRTDERCEQPTFADPHYHRVGIFALSYHKEGQKGYICEYRCVNCGRVLINKSAKGSFFIASKKLKEA